MLAIVVQKRNNSDAYKWKVPEGYLAMYQKVFQKFGSVPIFFVFFFVGLGALLSLTLHSAVRSLSSQRFALLALFTPRSARNPDVTLFYFPNKVS